MIFKFTDFKAGRWLKSLRERESDLENAKDAADSVNQLARKLLEIVFTKKALKSCTATGKFGARENHTMLCQKGLKAIYCFVKKHAIKKTLMCPKGWTKQMLKSMKRSICTKLNESK